MFGTWRGEIHYARREKSGKERFIRRDNNEMNVAAVASSSRLRVSDGIPGLPGTGSREDKSANVSSFALAAGRRRQCGNCSRRPRKLSGALPPRMEMNHLHFCTRRAVAHCAMKYEERLAEIRGRGSARSARG